MKQSSQQKSEKASVTSSRRQGLRSAS